VQLNLVLGIILGLERVRHDEKRQRVGTWPTKKTNQQSDNLRGCTEVGFLGNDWSIQFLNRASQRGAKKNRNGGWIGVSLRRSANWGRLLGWRGDDRAGRGGIRMCFGTLRARKGMNTERCCREGKIEEKGDGVMPACAVHRGKKKGRNWRGILPSMQKSQR